jgi:hypothetical protein
MPAMETLAWRAGLEHLFSELNVVLAALRLLRRPVRSRGSIPLRLRVNNPPRGACRA